MRKPQEMHRGMVPHHCHPSQLSLPGRARLPGLPRVAHLGGSPLANLLAELEVKIQLLRCAAVPPVASAAAAPPLLSNTRPGVVRLSTSHTHTHTLRRTQSPEQWLVFSTSKSGRAQQR